MGRPELASCKNRLINLETEHLSSTRSFDKEDLSIGVVDSSVRCIPKRGRPRNSVATIGNALTSPDESHPRHRARKLGSSRACQDVNKLNFDNQESLKESEVRATISGLTSPVERVDSENINTSDPSHHNDQLHRKISNGIAVNSFSQMEINGDKKVGEPTYSVSKQGKEADKKDVVPSATRTRNDGRMELASNISGEEYRREMMRNIIFQGFCGHHYHDRASGSVGGPIETWSVMNNSDALSTIEETVGDTDKQDELENIEKIPQGQQ